MSDIKTGAEVKQDRVNKMGEELGLLYDSLMNEIIWISFKWLDYVELFAVNQKRIDILNNSAPVFFSSLERILFRDVLLGLAKITDPAESRVGKYVHKNVSVQALPSLVDALFKKEVESRLREIETLVPFCRSWRNKIIAHKDLDTALQESAIPLEPANRKKVNELLKAVQELVNTVNYWYLHGTYDFPHLRPTDTYSLLRHLNWGHKYWEEKTIRMREGDIREGDFDKDDF
jgi:hypothetical protein